ncbi:protein-tyrosine phosphatase-like protein [Parachaetomium inaequale]|uniref:Protein-tyrosine phosphatase-like protein n=1 Tax=Parachaetomium inaequale TaxID=2588326 RepID=A0AAN6PG73_9PEZI|nr:protein-tyrosine phosphatase-like protein [Parachaetomium inaequale]
MGNNLHSSHQSTALPTAPYSARPPSPPYIHVPPPLPYPHLPPPDSSEPAPDPNNTNAPSPGSNNNGGGDILMTIYPSPAAVHTTTAPNLSPADLAAITGGASHPQCARDASSGWVYESRRAAQQVLDYLYLGPASAVKDRAFLVREGITMVLCARDARFASAAGSGGMLVAGVKRAVEGMGVVVEGIDVADGRELVGAFSVAAGRVNAHVLGVQRSGGDGRRGKVLVVCETGNDRSAAVVAAYLMAMYGLDTVQAVQFMQLQRFCVALGDEFKFQLQAYGDILRARGDVGAMGHYYQQQTQPQPQQQQQQPGEGRGGMGGGNRNGKRRIEQTMGDEGDEGHDMVVEMDDERYASRNFAPFVDRDY